MTTDPMPPCPYDKRGQHDLGAVIPETSDKPYALFCVRCGMTSTHAMDGSGVPLDALTEQDIKRAARG